MTLEPPWVDAETIPELRNILRDGRFSKVRIFEAWCEKGDRLAHVLRIRGRPLALALQMVKTSEIYAGAPKRNRSRLDHRSHAVAMWLDLDWHLYYLPSEEPKWPGQPRVLHPLVLGAQCQHERAPIPGAWLKEQVEKGIRKRVIDDATRWEMGVRRRGE
jgi:hypothetical protein